MLFLRSVTVLACCRDSITDLRTTGARKWKASRGLLRRQSGASGGRQRVESWSKGATKQDHVGTLGLFILRVLLDRHAQYGRHVRAVGGGRSHSRTA
jgi:hypothetical protein